MKTSVIILTWNGAAHVEPCLKALLAQDPPASEVIVVDNASADGTPDLVAERFPDVRLICNSRNLGFSAGNNVGLRMATGELLVLLNQDTQVHPGFLEAMERPFDDPTVGMVGCKLLYPDGTVQHAGGYFHGPRGETEHFGRLSADDGRFDEESEPEFVTGAALAISRQALTEIGPLDEGFTPAYYEDVDWCFRARARGWRVVYTPNAVVTHQELASANRSSFSHILSVNHGRVRFLLKHWPLDRLQGEFLPAEATWVAALPRVTWLMAARGAYFQALLDIRDILAFRGGSQREAEALIAVLVDLRAAALTSLEALIEVQEPGPVPDSTTLPSPHSPVTAAEFQESRPEQAPLQHASWTVRLWAKLGRLWSGLRYLDVLPDLVRHVQQHEQSLIQQSQLQVQQTEILRGQARDVAQNIRELTAIAEQLGRPDSDNGRGQ